LHFSELLQGEFTFHLPLFFTNQQLSKGVGNATNPLQRISSFKYAKSIARAKKVVNPWFFIEIAGTKRGTAAQAGYSTDFKDSTISIFLSRK
jgi:hypothetical protein